MAKVSIIIPTYNCAEWIVNAVKSVLSQTFQDFELIIVNDGSTDSTEEILQPYMDKIVYIAHKPNTGPSAARNSGIKAAQGELIAFLDADDLWLPHKLEMQVGFFDSVKDVDVVFSDFSYFGAPRRYNTGFEHHSTIRQIPCRRIGNVYAILESSIFLALLKDLFVSTCTIMVKRNCFEEIGFFDEELIVAEDWQMWLRLSKRFTFGFVDKILAKIRVRPNSLSNSEYRTISYNIQMIESLGEWIPQLSRKERKLVKKKLAESYFNMGYSRFSRYILSCARRDFLTSLSYDFQPKSMYYLGLSLLPKSLVKKFRAIKHS